MVDKVSSIDFASALPELLKLFPFLFGEGQKTGSSTTTTSSTADTTALQKILEQQMKSSDIAGNEAIIKEIFRSGSEQVPGILGAANATGARVRGNTTAGLQLNDLMARLAGQASGTLAANQTAAANTAGKIADVTKTTTQNQTTSSQQQGLAGGPRAGRNTAGLSLLGGLLLNQIGKKGDKKEVSIPNAESADFPTGAYTPQTSFSTTNFGSDPTAGFSTQEAPVQIIPLPAAEAIQVQDLSPVGSLLSDVGSGIDSSFYGNDVSSGAMVAEGAAGGDIAADVGSAAIDTGSSGAEEIFQDVWSHIGDWFADGGIVYSDKGAHLKYARKTGGPWFADGGVVDESEIPIPNSGNMADWFEDPFDREFDYHFKDGGMVRKKPSGYAEGGKIRRGAPNFGEAPTIERSTAQNFAAPAAQQSPGDKVTSPPMQIAKLQKDKTITDLPDFSDSAGTPGDFSNTAEGTGAQLASGIALGIGMLASPLIGTTNMLSNAITGRGLLSNVQQIVAELLNPAEQLVPAPDETEAAPTTVEGDVDTTTEDAGIDVTPPGTDTSPPPGNEGTPPGSTDAPPGDTSSPGNEGGDTGGNDGGSDGGGDGFESGGKINGPGGPVDDAITIQVSDGEYVLPTDTVDAIGIDVLNTIKALTHTPASEQRRGGDIKPPADKKPGIDPKIFKRPWQGSQSPSDSRKLPRDTDPLDPPPMPPTPAVLTSEQLRAMILQMESSRRTGNFRSY